MRGTAGRTDLSSSDEIGSTRLSPCQNWHQYVRSYQVYGTISGTEIYDRLTEEFS